MEKKKSNKKKYLVLLLALFVFVGGTMAWLTSESKLTNTFTIGQITPIDPDNNAPGGGETLIPDGDKNDETKLKGNLYEPSWDEDNSKIYPGATIAKDPYVGIGPKSEEAYIYVYVKNNMKNVYFIKNDEWEMVDATSYPGIEKAYTGGLFRYSQTLKPNDGKNVWTNTPLFSNVIASDKASFKDLTSDDATASQDIQTNTIEVNSFVHQAKDGSGQYIVKESVDSAAKDAFNIE